MSDEKQTILVIDDAPAQLELISGILGDTYRVKVATGGEMGLRVANKGTPPDLIILDLLMPGMTGRETLLAIRSEPVIFDVPVIILSAAGADVLGSDLDQEYFTALEKPVSPEDLKKAVAEALLADQ